MINSELIVHQEKALRVISSCRTLKQLDNAESFSIIVIRFLFSRLEETEMKREAFDAIEEISFLLNEKINECRKKIIDSAEDLSV